MEEGRNLRIAMATCEGLRRRLWEAEAMLSQAEEDVRAIRAALVVAEATAERLAGAAPGEE